MENTTEHKINQAVIGLNNDSVFSQLKEGSLTFAKNAMVENFDGNQITYQNEQSNTFCMNIKEGFVVIGHKNIVEQNRTIFFLLNPSTQECEIGQRINNTCSYTTIISSKCLNFQINYPVHKIIPKTTNCNTQLYWTDNINPRRWLDLDDLPFVEIPNPENETQPIKTDIVDCNKLLVQPNFDIPIIKPTGIDTGGQLKMGTYQFAIQYSNSLGEGYTSFYGFTNALGIFDVGPSPFTDRVTTKSIIIHIDNIDTTGLYDYFNLVVIETINNITTPRLIETVAINGRSTYDTTFTGNTKTDVVLSIEEIFQRFPYYDIAADVTTSDNSLLWVDLAVTRKQSLQKAFNNIILRWQTSRIPYNEFEAYNNPINTSEYRGYLRDEVYAFEIAAVYANGKIGDAYHIPGPAIRAGDEDIIENDDAYQITENPCDEKIGKKRWQVYNTATVTGFTEEYLAAEDKSCYKGSYQYGEFAYWESTRTYPYNRDIYGELAGKPIRFHKFPDCLVSPIHDGENIYPIGVTIDPYSLYNALLLIDEEERSQIVGFKITRANRANNQSIIAKGLLFNVGTYTRDGQSYYYPNYPFNDLRPDPFISNSPVQPHSGSNTGNRLQGFNLESKRRMTFHSPNTAFDSPTGVDSGYLKLETVEYGKTKSHFVQVEDNAKYKFLTSDTVRVAFAAGMSSIAKFEISAGFPTGIKASPGIDLSSAIPVFSATLEVLKNITPATNYGWSFNSVGDYNRSFGIPNNGNKNRSIETGSYLASGFQSVSDTYTFNNYLREASVYLRTNLQIPFPHEYDTSIPIDNSRFTHSEIGCDSSPANYYQRDISSIYGSIKRIFPDQYGFINSYESVDTGFYHLLYDENGQKFSSFPTIYGGDTYINKFALKRKHAFFLNTTVGQPDGTDIALDQLGNVAYPIYYYSTGPRDITVDFSDLDTEINAIVDPGFWNILLNLVSGGVRPIASGLIILNRIMRAYVNTLGVPNVNLECSTTKVLNEVGTAYLYAYGIPYFFVESNINVDYRYATNDREGDFYPHVSSDIPDRWLQEINVPIVQDNTYNYNITYNKQIKELFISHLRPDFDPNKVCLSDFPNRVIYSQKSTLEETKNNWLIYRPVSYFDFPKSYGTVTAIDGLEDRKVLTRFENKSLLYNVYQTTDASTGTVYLGNPLMFSQPPLDFAETDTGYNGCQHKLLIKTEYGHITVDALRGQIFMYRGNQITDLSSHGLSKYFTENLSFKIKDFFPNAKIDNHYNGIGLTGVHDTKYDRLIITKRDYRPLSATIKYDDQLDQYYIIDGNNVRRIVSLSDPVYFCDLSYTISYCFSTGTWISFHSYIPNYYIQHPGYFETGLNGNTPSLWTHNRSIRFQEFYGKVEDYIVEYPLILYPNEEIVSSFRDYTTIIRYDDEDVYYEVDDQYFNQAIIYNTSQCTGILNLIPRPKGNLQSYMLYPKFNTTSKDILVTKKDGQYQFNTFWDVVQDKTKAFFRRPCSIPSLDKIFDVNLDYGVRSHNKARIRCKEAKIRLIRNSSDQYKLISKFIITETVKSKI